MGVFANWVEDAIRRELGDARGDCAWLGRLARFWARLRPRPLDPGRTAVLADFEPSPEQLLDKVGALPALLVLPFSPRVSIPGVSYGQYQPDSNPLIWDAKTDALIGAAIDTLATFLPWSEVHGRTLLSWWRRGVQRCWFLREPRAVGISAIAAAAWKIAQGVGRKIRRRTADAMTLAESRALAASLGAPPVPPAHYGRITHVISSLTSGGAERQVCNTAIRQKQAGFDVRVVLQEPPHGRKGHYLPLLQEAGIPVTWAGSRWHDAFIPAWQQRHLELRALRRLPPDLLAAAVDLAGELLLRPTDVLHSWLDKPNIVAVLAGRLAAVPRTVLSLRAVNPERCPRLLLPWMKNWYRTAGVLPGVAIVANSQAGARDYEEWLGFATGTIRVLRNAFVPPPYPHPAAIARFRKEHGLSPATPTVACVFRLDPEKRPLWVIGLLARLRKRVSQLRVLMAGCGALEDQVKQEIHRLGLENMIALLGARKDVPVILAASQVLLLASEIEGTPNVSLEAQHFGCIPVLTDAGGSRETIVPEETGLLCALSDAGGLVAAVEALLRDPERRAKMALAGRAFVGQRFDPQRIHEETLAVYDALSGLASRATQAAA